MQVCCTAKYMKINTSHTTATSSRRTKVLRRFLGCDYRRSLDPRMDLLTTCTQDAELQALTALSLISTLYKSLEHTLILLSLLSLAVSW
jgi:hypothetical protein